MRDGWRRDKAGCLAHLAIVAIVLGSCLFCIIRFWP